MDINFYNQWINVFKNSFALNFIPQLVFDVQFLMKLNEYSHPEHLKQFLVILILNHMYPKAEDLIAVMLIFEIASLSKNICLYYGFSRQQSEFFSFFLRTFLRSGIDILNPLNVILITTGFSAACLGQFLEKKLISCLKNIY